MMISRLFSRNSLVAWVLVLIVFATAPVAAFGKVYRANGHNGAEGDPGDGLDAIRGGSRGDYLISNEIRDTLINLSVIIPCVSNGVIYITWFPPSSLSYLVDFSEHPRQNKKRFSGGPR